MDFLCGYDPEWGIGLMENHEELEAVLEWEAVFHEVSRYAVSPSGVQKLQSLPYFSDPERLEHELKRVTEMRDLLRYDDPFPLESFPDISSILHKANVSGAVLSPQEFLAVLQVLSLARKIHEYLKKRGEKYPTLHPLGMRLVPLEKLEREILSRIDPSGEVKDSASKALSQIRQELKEVRQSWRKRLEGILREMVRLGYAQEDQLVWREGRLLIPMKEAFQHKLKGVVVDQSATGATVFMEPLEALELINRIRRLELQEKQEIHRILSALTEKLQLHLETIIQNFECLSEIDSISARAQYSNAVGGNAPEIDRDKKMMLRHARHPILLARRRPEEVVPLDLELGGECHTLVITGPNAGGKTVLLKTVGLLSLMTLRGMHIPANEGTRIPLFSKIFADIGDQQSIEKDLSTFSSHVQNWKEILQNADANSLVLLDEMGSFTDPEEGTALAVGILKALGARGCLTIATTHIGALKVFAHEEPGIQNGSMRFDQETLQPTYRFQPGIPGASYAFEIAEKYGFPPEVLEKARAYRKGEHQAVDRLIFSLSERLQKAEALSQDLEIERTRLKGLIELYESKLKQISTEAEERKEVLLEEAETALREIRVLKERMVRELRQSKAEPSVVKKIHQQIKEHESHLEAMRIPRNFEDSKVVFREGDWVAWEGHGGVGRVIGKADAKGRVLVEWDEFKMRIPVNELAHAEPVSKIRSGGVKIQAEKLSSPELDIRGKTVDDSINLLMRFLGDALASGFSEVRIIHGKGTGVLRKKIREFLSTQPMVKSFRDGQWNEGDIGVTIVELQ